ncbi:MAG TPA: dihydroorotate dehydrogenase, partial [Spirochaetota bacterium]|nr:dihydroorotate dehydrogenase [Spirochaetota bacterium]
ISCPNVADEFGLPFASDPKISGEITRVAKNSTKLPVIIKLSPNYPNICEVAKSCEANGADGITAINTLGPGMLIDVHTYKPKLSNKKGGVSGPAIFPVALRIVYDLYKAIKIPIIGMGGVTEAEDAIQMIAAGATLYGVGTGILYKGTSIFKNINAALDNYLAEKKMKYEELIGIAHRI